MVGCWHFWVGPKKVDVVSWTAGDERIGVLALVNAGRGGGARQGGDQNNGGHAVQQTRRRRRTHRE